MLRWDHQNLGYFTKKRLRNHQQARWWEFLLQFNYRIEFEPGAARGKGYASRMMGQTAEEVLEDETHRMQVVVKSQSVSLLADILLNFGVPSLKELWTEGYQADPLPTQKLKILEREIRHGRLIWLAECTQDGNRPQY